MSGVRQYVRRCRRVKETPMGRALCTQQAREEFLERRAAVSALYERLPRSKEFEDTHGLAQGQSDLERHATEANLPLRDMR